MEIDKYNNYKRVVLRDNVKFFQPIALLFSYRERKKKGKIKSHLEDQLFLSICYKIVINILTTKWHLEMIKCYC